MAQFSDPKKLNSSFFHSLSKTQTENTQNVFESSFKSGHNILAKDIMVEQIPFAADVTSADLIASSSLVVKKYNLVDLTPVAGSNNQAWQLFDGTDYIHPFISPVDVMDNSGNISFGYQTNIYKADGNRIFPTTGSWNIDYYSGLILFDVGFTPTDLGYGNIKVSCFTYIGKTLDQVLAGIGGTDLVFTFNTPVTTWVINHNMNTLSLRLNTFDFTNKEMFADVVYIDSNNIEIRFSQPKSGFVIIGK